MTHDNQPNRPADALGDQGLYDDTPLPRRFAAYPWLPFVLPMAVYMVLSSFEPGQPEPGIEQTPNSLGLTYEDYPLAYTVKIAITVGVLAWCWPAYRHWPLRVSPLAIGVGVVGVVLWIGICRLGVEDQLVSWLGEENPLVVLLGLGARPSYNPFEQLGHAPMLAWAFLVVRFFGLSLVVPVFEEALIRGWLMRNVVSPEFWRVAFGRVTAAAVAWGILFPTLYHPEKLAALVWFALITWLMVRTRNFWDCVAAHAVTNFLLGIYVVTTGSWELW
ncbi:CAAX amino terminal protease self- immunity [Pseudobythopirellula maris]|uniref:CAAX amino terminal protease self-immunity n=1 Tax=Pseudobythopirellula maris TaxID=2527991 RepID=A0A5C5ZN42_9BACT|nr:CAAX prenyl protease-related protein [Pseudobythopirellula maris]TWT88261.1 CAAX amino terminal protease self- immunity [Pseudobythopirellula maris]